MSGIRPTATLTVPLAYGGPNPEIFVVDTSVALKWYLPEARSAEALIYMDQGLDRHAPNLMPIEASHALLKRTRRNPPEIGPAVALTVALELRDVAPIRYHADQPLLHLALNLAFEIGCSSYDGLFLALANQLDCRLVTADRPFFEKIRAGRHKDRAWWFMDPP